MSTCCLLTLVKPVFFFVFFTEYHTNILDRVSFILMFVCLFVILFLLDQGIDKETFLSLEESGNLNDLIPRTGPRVKFRKRLREYLQVTCFCILYVFYEKQIHL